MDNRLSEDKSPDKQSVESTGTKTVMADLVEVKKEPDIKLEPDEVDTIEYTVTSHQLNGIFVPKEEKIELDDDNHDEVDETRLQFDRVEHHDSFNFHVRIGSKNETKSKQTECSSSKTHRTNEGMKATKKQRKIGFDGAGVPPATKSKASTNKRKITSALVNSAQKARRTQLAKQHKCSKCEYTTLNSCHLKRHMRTHTGEKPFPCENCPKRYTSKQNLRSHMKVHVTKDSLNCSICWQIFATDTERLDHELTCTQRRYECHLCKKFSTLNIPQMKLHMRVHNGERPFQCDQCFMKFTQKLNMKRHMKTHIKSRPEKLRCSVCARNFLTESEKDTHAMNCKRRRYECYLCQSYMASDKSHLQYHMRKHHTGERPFKCSLCEKCYASGSNLKRHMKNNCKK